MAIPLSARLLYTIGCLLALMGLLAVTFQAQAVTHHKTAICIGCHTGSGRIFTDPKTGEQKDVTMDIVRFRHAVHAKMVCTDCHVEGFLTFPHFQKKILGCIDCHPRKEEPREEELYEFLRIDREFKETVHYTEHPKEFSCEECHHPHYFKSTAKLGPPQMIIEAHNAPCLRCHAQDAEGPLADPAKASLVEEHAWFPHPEQHLRSTRCIDCHSGTEHTVSHLLPIREAGRDCVSCHTEDSALLRLYRYETEKMQQKAGFENTVVLEDAYVMGATRHGLLDRLTYFLVGGALLFVAAHGTLRLVRRRRDADKAGQGDGR